MCCSNVYYRFFLWIEGAEVEDLAGKASDERGVIEKWWRGGGGVKVPATLKSVLCFAGGCQYTAYVTTIKRSIVLLSALCVLSSREPRASLPQRGQ